MTKANPQSHGALEACIRAIFADKMKTILRKMEVKDLVHVDVYFPVLQYIDIKITEDTPITTFVANVGGNLGKCLLL